ncbi:MAG: diguanylate cyclase (GGDEF)-like protein [Lentisphaeria bacterium]|jgi:diguanylate cyclase (GGDEF)-like protein
MKILLVEDSATIRYAMCAYITSSGHVPIVAESGEEALQYLDTTPVDMVIMDVEMPGLDGFETTRLIREWLGDHWIPIIFVTGKSEASSLEEAIAAGGDDYLIKPVNEIILNAKIRAMERITEMRNQLNLLNQELTILSQRDGLTQLYNRRTFQEKALEIWESSARNKQPFAILLLDIDHFKLYNDCYGHPAGDECIRLVAQTLSKCLCRAVDVVARYGGEEFIAILPNTPETGAQYISELLRSSIEALAIKHRESTAAGVVTVSLGAVVVNFTTGTNLAHQIEQADRYLYESKLSGRNCITVREFNPQNRLLVVGDCEETLAFISKTLGGRGTVLTALHPVECIPMAEEYRPDMILIDDVFPGSSVADLREKLKTNPKTSFLPVFTLYSSEHYDNDGSDHEREERAVKNELFGPDRKLLDPGDFIQKPLDAEVLLSRIQPFLHE